MGGKRKAHRDHLRTQLATFAALGRRAVVRSNAEIASELFVGNETVKTYVGTLLGKLGVRDRTQAAIAAYESGFIGLQ